MGEVNVVTARDLVLLEIDKRSRSGSGLHRRVGPTVARQKRKHRASDSRKEREHLILGQTESRRLLEPGVMAESKAV
jgi:hypothetical protein